MGQQKQKPYWSDGDDDPLAFILARYIAQETEITRHIAWMEQRLGVRLYPSIPQPERGKPGIARVYLRIPFQRGDEDEGEGRGR